MCSSFCHREHVTLIATEPVAKNRLQCGHIKCKNVNVYRVHGGLINRIEGRTARWVFGTWVRFSFLDDAPCVSPRRCLPLRTKQAVIGEMPLPFLAAPSSDAPCGALRCLLVSPTSSHHRIIASSLFSVFTRRSGVTTWRCSRPSSRQSTGARRS